MRTRLIIELEYAEATEEDRQEVDNHLASFVTAAVDSHMLISEALEAQGVRISRCGVALQPLTDDGAPLCTTDPEA